MYSAVAVGVAGGTMCGVEGRKLELPGTRPSACCDDGACEDCKVWLRGGRTHEGGGRA